MNSKNIKYLLSIFIDNYYFQSNLWETIMELKEQIITCTHK